MLTAKFSPELFVDVISQPNWTVLSVAPLSHPLDESQLKVPFMSTLPDAVLLVRTNDNTAFEPLLPR